MPVKQLLLILLVLSGSAAAAELGNLATVNDGVSQRASSYDVTGGNGDSLIGLEPRSTHVLLDADGPGCIRHMWMTLSVFPNHTTFLRDLVLRIYWEDNAVPSVEVPLGDFFGLAHCRRYAFQSAAIAVGQHASALNCYWPMPFYKHARVEIYNAGARTVRRFYYHIDYEIGPIAPRQGYFHAVFHRDRGVRGQSETGNTTGKDNYVVLDTEGQGQYVGCLLAIDAQQAERWFEGDDMIYIDGSPEPTIHGTGTEDYFCNAWGYREAFSYPYYGAPLLERRPDGGLYAALYRQHIPDPIRFKKRIRVTFEHLFDRSLVNDYASVAYWYQLEPIRSREPLPENNYPLDRRSDDTPVVDLNASELEPRLLAAGRSVRVVFAELDAGYLHGGYIEIQTHGRAVEIPLTVPARGWYRVEVKPVLHLIQGQVKIGLKGGRPSSVPSRSRDAMERVEESRTPFFNIGTIEVPGETLTMTIEGNETIGLDQIRIYRTDPPSSQAVGEP